MHNAAHKRYDDLVVVAIITTSVGRITFQYSMFGSPAWLSTFVCPLVAGPPRVLWLMAVVTWDRLLLSLLLLMIAQGSHHRCAAIILVLLMASQRGSQLVHFLSSALLWPNNFCHHRLHAY